MVRCRNVSWTCLYWITHKALRNRKDSEVQVFGQLNGECKFSKDTEHRVQTDDLLGTMLLCSMCTCWSLISLSLWSHQKGRGYFVFTWTWTNCLQQSSCQSGSHDLLQSKFLRWITRQCDNRTLNYTRIVLWAACPGALPTVLVTAGPLKPVSITLPCFHVHIHVFLIHFGHLYICTWVGCKLGSVVA